MLRDDYLKAAFPDRHTVLAVPLRDYSLGHELLLERVNSPFVRPGVATAADLFIALAICSRPFEEAADLLNAADFPEWLDGFTRAAMKSASRPARWWQVQTPLRVEHYIAAFARYVAAAKHGPGLDWRREEGASEVMTLGSHPLHVIKITLMAELHFTEREALSLPYALAHWNYVTFFECKGKASLYDRAERIRQERNDRARLDEFETFIRGGGNPREFKPSLAWATLN